MLNCISGQPCYLAGNCHCVNCKKYAANLHDHTCKECGDKFECDEFHTDVPTSATCPACFDFQQERDRNHAA